MDRTDRQLLHAGQIDPRASYARIGAALGVSEQTAARRYQRMRSEGVLRVIGLTDGEQLGQTNWSVRIGCRPGTASTLADVLARRDDVSWVSIAAGGSELSALVRGYAGSGSVDGGPEQVDLLNRLPQASNVLSMSARTTLHRFVGQGAVDWIGLGDLLDDAQRDRLLDRHEPPAPTGAPEPLSAQDQPLLDVLARDGRASYATLAAATGWTQSRAARRVCALQSAGALYFDVDVAISLVGFRSVANLWLTVAPAHLVDVGQQLADHIEIAFVAAITGSANLIATAVCRDAAGLYDYVTTKIAAIDGVRQMEISPVLRRVKQAGSLVERGRLSDPAPPGRRRRVATD